MAESYADAQSSDVKELTEKIGNLSTQAGELSDRLQEAVANGEGYAELKEQFGKAKTDLAGLIEERDRKERDLEVQAQAKELKDLLSQVRTPSKAHLFGGNVQPQANEEHWASTLARAQNVRIAGSFDAMTEAKAALDAMGSTWANPDPEAKATVGDSDAAGGYLVPNNVVADINLQATAGRQVVDLFTVINGVRGSAVDIPWEQETIGRAVIAAAGATKENSNFITNNYTATLYTLARIFDVGNQLLRQSEGAAEALVRSKLARAFALGEDYYVLQGSGSSQPYGLLTAIGTSGTYVTTFSSPSDSTVAGSVAAAISQAAGALENRGAQADGVVLNTADFWEMTRQGADSAGFYFVPSSGPTGLDVTRGTLSIWGLTARRTPNMPSDSLVVGEFKSATFFRGQGYRVDTSSEAGTRWDTNLTGFRGEEEIAFDARPSVYTGHFQRITNAVP